MNETIDLEKFSVEQLRKIKESLEKKAKVTSQKIKKQKGSVIDKFTNIDELIYENNVALQDLIQDQRETNRQLQITNKLLLALYFKEDSDGNLVASQPNAIDSGEILREISRGGSQITRVITETNKTITGDESIFQEEFEGAIAELLFVSSTSSSDNAVYGVRVIADDNNIYEDTYSNFSARSNIETDMAAFEDEINSWYLLQFQNVYFQNSIKIEVYNSTATFERIYIKYHRSV